MQLRSRSGTRLLDRRRWELRPAGAGSALVHELGPLTTTVVVAW